MFSLFLILNCNKNKYLINKLYSINNSSQFDVLIRHHHKKLFNLNSQHNELNHIIIKMQFNHIESVSIAFSYKYHLNSHPTINAQCSLRELDGTYGSPYSSSLLTAMFLQD